MKNVSIELKGDKAIITVDLQQSQGLSASGKSIIIATTEGNTAIPGTNAVIGLNVYKKA
jgi:hypothetical protein